MANGSTALACLTAKIEVHAQIRSWAQRIKLVAIAVFFLLWGARAAGLGDAVFSPTLAGALFGIVLCSAVFGLLSALAHKKLSRQFSELSAQTLIHESRNQIATP